MVHLIPQPPDIFIGREREIERIRQSLDGRRLFFLEGIEGIGKTCLALVLANTLEKEHPGRVIWISCKEGWHIESLLHEMVEWLPEDFYNAYNEWEENNHLGLEERLLYLINILNMIEAYVFVEDLHFVKNEYFTQIVLILKKYLIEARFFFISRERPSISPVEMLDFFEIRLEGLQLEEGGRLVEALLSSRGFSPVPERTVLEEIVKKLCGHPFLMKTFVALALEGLGNPLELLDNLPDFFQEMEKNLISKVLDGLSDSEHEILELLSISRIPLPKEMIGDQAIKENLERRFLLSRDSRGRYTVHFLIRQSIQRSLEKKDTVPYHLKLARFFKESLAKEKADVEMAREAIHNFYLAGLSDDVIELLAQYGGMLSSNGYYDEIIQYTDRGELPHPLVVTRANVLSILGRWKEATELLSKLEGSVKEDKMKAEVLSSLAGAYLNQGRLGESLSYYEKALQLLRKTKNKKGILKVENYLTFIHAFRGELSKASEFSDEAISIARELGDDASIAHSLRMKGLVLLERYHYREALDVSIECLTRAKKVGAARLTSWALLNGARALLGLGNLEESGNYVQEGLQRGERSLDTQVIGFFRREQAHLMFEEGKIDEATAELKKAEESFIHQGNRLGAAIAKLTGAQIYLEKGVYREAQRELEDVLAIATAHSHFILAVKTRSTLADLLLQKGDLAKAREMLEKNLEECSTIDDDALTAETHLLLAETCLREQDRKKGEAEVKEALRIARSGDSFPFIFTSARATYLAAVMKGEGNEEKAAMQEEASHLAGKLIGALRRQALKYFERIESLTGQRYFIKTQEVEKIALAEEVEALRKRRDEFSLFIDLAEKTVWERDKGEISVLGKRIISTLLIHLVKHAGKGFTAEEIFSAVWGYEFDELSSPGEVRKNISRLRGLIEKDPSSSVYVKLAEGLMKQKGKYYFDDRQSFCLIEPVSI